MSRPRIGLFGGTFNPIHQGHLRAGEQVRERFNLDKVLFIPSFLPPHKRTTDIASPRDRLAMVRLAVAGHAGFVASSLEVRARQKSYSIITLTKVKALYPKAQVFFILGADAFLEIETWKSYQEVLAQCRFIIVRRPGYRLSQARRVVPEKLKPKTISLPRSPSAIPAETVRAHRIFLLDINPFSVSSTEIRRRVREGLPIAGLVPPGVEDYIRKHKLYLFQGSNG